MLQSHHYGKIMNNKINQRKLEHLRAIADDPDIERYSTGFDSIKLCHRALPNLDFDAIDTRVSFLGKTLSFPLLVSSMTGGDSAEIVRINHNLASAAEQCGVAMAVGSQRVMFSTSAARNSFDLRHLAPSVPLLSNLGAVQLNLGFGIKECQEAVDILQADGLYLHLNPLQEAVQPEGDRNFANLNQRISDVVRELSVPVLLKEVGSGMSKADIASGVAAGVRHFDVAGRGGTSWSRIEYHRTNDNEDDLGLQFQDWGLTTVQSLREATLYSESHAPDIVLIASGGLRSGMDMAKAIVMGAHLCGIAAPLLYAAQISQEAVVAKIEAIRRAFKTTMFLLGCANCSQLRRNTSLLHS